MDVRKISLNIKTKIISYSFGNKLTTNCFGFFVALKLEKSNKQKTCYDAKSLGQWVLDLL